MHRCDSSFIRRHCRLQPPLGTISFVLLCYQWGRQHAGHAMQRTLREQRRYRILSQVRLTY